MRVVRGLVIAAALIALASDALAQRSNRRPVTEADRRAAEATLDGFSAPTLTPFGSDADFQRYVMAVRQFERTRGDYYYSAAANIQFAQASTPGQSATQSDAAPPPCIPTPTQACPETDEGERGIVVTGSRVPPAHNPSITNNQERGVEEGDIVKQIDHFLLTLQDGRIFVTDIDAGGAGRLALTDRANVYRNAQLDMWYDEMLVFGDRVLITGYSYDAGATELAVFRLSPAGRLSREGVFRISSNDYYSGNNYATRLIDGNLITYTPLRIEDMARADYKWPVVRRWLPADDAREAAFHARRVRNWQDRPEEPAEAGPPLVDAAHIYRPLRRLTDPAVHTVSVCPLATSEATGGLECRTTAFVGPGGPEWYVTPDDIYLWTTSNGERYGGGCDTDSALTANESNPALVYRVPLDGGRPSVIGAHGLPPDQFAMQADERNLYALVRLVPEGCRQSWRGPTQLGFYALPLARLGPRLTEAPPTTFTELPGTLSYSVASRFSDRYLVYGGMSRFRRYPDFSAYDDFPADYRRQRLAEVREDLRPKPVIVVPIGRPEAYQTMDVGHTVIRAERVGNDILLTGYRDGRGLTLTLIDLAGRPRVGSSALLAGRYESEGRSHAFNSLQEQDGSGLMGLPTVRQISDSDRNSWRSRASDLSFLALDRNRRLRPIGELERRFDYVDDYDEARREEDEDGVPGYKCEVSCIDWYGNSRPIFTGGRIFGLAGTELIEGRVVEGRISEVQRLNIAIESERRSAN